MTGGLGEGEGPGEGYVTVPSGETGATEGETKRARLPGRGLTGREEVGPVWVALRMRGGTRTVR